MERVIKYTWITTAIMGSIAVIINLPYDIWQKAYLNEIDRIQSTPLKRIDATNRYIEAIENGQEDISKGIKTTPPQKYYREIPYQKLKRVGRLYLYNALQEEPDEEIPEVEEKNKYEKPLYKRDKKNPFILHKLPRQ